MNAIQSIFWGIMAALGALVLETTLALLFPGQASAGSALRSLTPFLVIVILMEEIFKLLIILKTSRPLTGKKELLLNASLIGLGFALTESLLVSANEILSTDSLYQGIIGIFVIHFFTAVLLGFFILNFPLRGFFYRLWPLLLMTVFHLIYNSLLIYGASLFIVRLFLFFLVLSFSWLIFYSPPRSSPEK